MTEATGRANHGAMSGTIDRLVSVGNVVIDLTATVPALPERGGDVVATDSRLTPGGSFNVLVAASRQGLRAAYGGAHGTGPFGELARSAMLDERIEILLEPTAGADTGYDVALTDAGGERTFITAVGAEASLTAERLAGIELRAGDAVHVSGYGLLRSPNRDAIADWLLRIPSGLSVFVDPGPLGEQIPRDVLEPVRARADWWSCNAREATLATGLADPLEATRALAAAAPGCGVVVRLGPDGCLVGWAGAVEHVAGFPVRVVDTNGAGDAHVGGFIAALAGGADPVQAARRANACAAIAVSLRGPATAPTKDEVDALLRGSIR
ncbi:MAG TPA: PfkB family carbohydrate kinase [Microbacteriaceae bacterium]|jgi:sugar/nucleoside kinase (ribokinase family)|nr:PfkB family carbohydrate kinase [Microbacteriaceae bacterium]